jgi:formate dehydrogenase subunit delta
MSAAGLERLVYMANQIARFFVSQPGDVAALSTADHLNAFWDPRMRRQIVDHLGHGGEGLDPIALDAVRLLKTGSPETVEHALAAAGEPSTGHQPGSDAG